MEENKSSSTPVVWIVVVIVLLCCCCAALAAIGGYSYYAIKDIGTVLPPLTEIFSITPVPNGPTSTPPPPVVLTRVPD